MPLVHCNKCHHEWECATNSESDRKCDWCGGDSYILTDDTPLSNMMKTNIIEKLLEMNNPYADKIVDKMIKVSKKKK
jgi:tRNA G26 N,N-dimethylase Trm1